jgi:nucleoside phosphorylase
VPISILIITPLPEEREAFVSLLPELEENRLKSGWTIETTHLQAQAGTIGIGLLMIGEMGNVAAVPPTLEAIDMLHPSFVIAVGIAGGVREQVDLDDVIVAEQILYVERGKVTNHQVVPELIATDCSKLLVHEAKLLASSLSRDVTHQRDLFKVQFGALASGEKVIADTEYLEELRKRHRKIIGVEMESHGIAFATQYATPKIDFIAVRGVSDFADELKDDSHRAAACQNAASFVMQLITELPISSRVEGDAAHPKILTIKHVSIARVLTSTVTQSLDPNISLSQLNLDHSAFSLGTRENIRNALVLHEQVPQRYDEFKENNPEGLVCYFGLAHIPLAFDLGYRLTNKRPVRLFEFDRYQTVSPPWKELTVGSCMIDLSSSGLPVTVSNEVGDVVVRISISAKIHETQIAEFSKECLASVNIGLAKPRRDAISSMTEIALIGKEFRECLDNIYAKLPNLKDIHIFIAGPCSLAMYLGQLLLSSTDSRIICYNFDNNSKIPYSWGLRISQDMDPGDRFVVA